MMAGWLIAYGAVLLLSFGWSWYEMAHAPTDKELWGGRDRVIKIG